MSTAIAFEGVSKHYRGARTYRALRDDLVAGLGRIVGIRREPRQAVVALDNVSFEVEVGQSFALIGPNGAGKTTALKLATRIAYPTAGRIRVLGRVGALIEVGTGMHPELTGRENVRLYGRILGLSRRQIESRFDEIVEFSGIPAAIDQPVKQYSSGMQLRLGFSIAAHLEPDVLLVDEAIAVGDASFQYRCVERMAQLVREGRTLVFVSHDMSAIETLCRRAILLENGRIAFEGQAREAVRTYLSSVQAERMASDHAGAARGERLTITSVSLHDATGSETNEFRAGDQMTVRLHYEAAASVEAPIFSVGLHDGRIGVLSVASMLVDGNVPTRLIGKGHIDCTFEHLPLRPRTYEIWGSVRGAEGYGELVGWQRLRLFRILEHSLGTSRSSVIWSLERAPIVIPYKWGFGGITDPLSSLPQPGPQ
jgi:ABC-type polysaccharide/polyol phosphate transport system ATPase subunit